MTEITTQVAYRKNVSTDINPMPLWQALFFFGLPALLFRIFSYQGIPTFVRLGLTPLEAYIAGWTIPAAILFAAMLVGALYAKRTARWRNRVDYILRQPHAQADRELLS